MSRDSKGPATVLDDALGSLPRHVEPGHDLWPAIEARLEPRGARGSRRWPWAAAAAVLLAVGASLITANRMRREDATVAQPAPAAGQAAFAAVAFGPGQALDPAYETARQGLARSLSARIDRLPPDARQKLEKNLALLRQASAEINAALELSPGDPLLEELLLSTYQEELAVLASVNQLTGANGAAAKNDTTRMQL
jgi:hypothetical protein